MDTAVCSKTTGGRDGRCDQGRVHSVDQQWPGKYIHQLISTEFVGGEKKQKNRPAICLFSYFDAMQAAQRKRSPPPVQPKKARPVSTPADFLLQVSLNMRIIYICTFLKRERDCNRASVSVKVNTPLRRWRKGRSPILTDDSGY